MADGARGGASGKEPDRGFKEVQQEVCPTEVELAAEDKCAGGYEGDAGGGDGEACRRLMVEARVAAEAESQDDGDPFSHKGGAPDGWKHSVMAAPGWAVQELCKGLWWLARCLFLGGLWGGGVSGWGLDFPGPRVPGTGGTHVSLYPPGKLTRFSEIFCRRLVV